MAAKTPDSVLRDSLGSVTRLACLFSSNNIDDGDTYTSNLSGIKYAWFQAEGTTGLVGVSKTAGGEITFLTGVEADDMTGTLYLEGNF